MTSSLRVLIKMVSKDSDIWDVRKNIYDIIIDNLKIGLSKSASHFFFRTDPSIAFDISGSRYVVDILIRSKMDKRNENMEHKSDGGIDNLAFDLSPEDPGSKIQFQDLPQPEVNQVEIFLNRFENFGSCQGIQQCDGQTQWAKI